MTMSGNLHYRTEAIARYYRRNRVRWDQFYPSEREVIARLGLNTEAKVLDVGCGCGGLGLALRERFGVEKYTGVEINHQAVAIAEEINPAGRFIAADILELTTEDLPAAAFDIVVSLGCIDWNVEFERMLSACWRFVRPGGFFVSSFRLALDEGVNDVERSFQHIRFEDEILEGDEEIAPYVVLNAGDLFRRLKKLEAAGMTGHGYWGKPSRTARTPYNEVCFAVLGIRKGINPSEVWDGLLDLPADITEAAAVRPK